MATTTWNVSKDSRIAFRTSDGWEAGSGVSNGLPVGQYSGYRYRTLLGFSYSFSGMVTITSAILNIRTSSQIHVAFGSDPDLYVQRLTSSFSEGTSDALSSSNAVTWANQPSATSTNQATADITTVESTWDAIDITALIVDAFNAGTFYGLKLRAVDETDATDVTEFFSSEFSTSSDAYISVTYTTNTAPNAPTTPTPTADALIAGLTPTFQATFSDPDIGDLMANAQVIVYEDNGTTVKWDSGTFAATGTTFSKVYAGPALTGNTFYKWKGRTADDDGAWGVYTALNRFKVNSAPNAPSTSLTESPTSDIKTLTPTFNLTHSDPDASDSSMLGYRIILETSGGSGVWDSGDLSISATVSKSHLYAGPALSWQTAYRWRARTKDSNGVWGAYSSNATFTTHTTGVPISLDPTGSEIASSITPTFVGSRATSADSLTSSQIIVYASNGTTQIWDSGTFTAGVTSTGFSKVYSGTALAAATTYKWKARVTSSVGGTSSYSALQTFVTPDTNTPSGTAPVGSGVTPVTNLNFTFTRSTNFNDHEFTLYQSDGTTVVTTDAPTSYTATGSKTFVYSGTLAYNTVYKWKVRVSSDGGTNWSPYTSLITFTTDAAGIPTLNFPQESALLGAPHVVDEYDDITAVTNGTSASASLETGAGLFQTGIGALKVALTTLASSGTSYTYRTTALDLSKYGSLTPFYAYIRCSSLTNVATTRLRFTFSGNDANYAEFDVQPAAINTWYQKSLVKGTPTATGGTVNWASVTKIGLYVTASGGGSVTSNFYLDDLKFDAVNPAFDGTTYNSEVVSTFRIRVYAADQTTLVWDSGDIAGSGTAFARLYAGTALTKGATYYWQARYVKSTGPTGDYSALRAFTLNSDPSISTGLSPASGSIVTDSIVPRFAAAFNDSEKVSFGDAPTYMEVEVYRNSDSVLAYYLISKTGLIASTNEIYDGLSGTVKVTGAAAPIAYETEYKYRVRYYDSMGARGSWSSYTNFKPSQSPVATITSPADAGTVTSPSFNVTWSMSSPGGKGQNSYRVRVIRDSDLVTLIDTGQVFSSVTTYVVPAGYLVNTLVYRIELTLWDTDQMPDPTPDVNTVTAAWTAPDPVQNFTVTDDVSLSASSMSWAASNLSPTDFRKYVIYRKLSTSTNWDILTTSTNKSQVTYLDFTAANTVSYQYKITQLQIVPGDVDLESGDSDIGSTTLDTDSWFVIGADRNESHIFELPVTSAPFIEPVQQEVFEPLGTSRKVIIRGKVMGAEGTLQAKWDTSERATAIAQVAYIKSNAGPHILKSPFGDVWNVEFSGPNKEYEAGGHFTTTIVWTEVT